MRLRVQNIEGQSVFYRPGTSDERVLNEVIHKRCYRRVKDRFDVEAGERWLDLGANIGAFAVYCRLRGATADCYEPDVDCFSVLMRNARGFRCRNTAVTSLRVAELDYWVSKDRNNLHTGSVLKSRSGVMVPHGTVNNVCADTLDSYDGVKMDIEGSEMGILDAQMLPRCHKLVIEYHSRRDPSSINLKKRLGYLKDTFDMVRYPPEFDRRIAAGVNEKTFYARLIHCWNNT